MLIICLFKNQIPTAIYVDRVDLFSGNNIHNAIGVAVALDINMGDKKRK